MKIQRNRSNYYFDTYHVFNDNGVHVGIVEDHLRGVKQAYYEAWHTEKPHASEYAKEWKTKMFYDRDMAIKFALEGCV